MAKYANFQESIEAMKRDGVYNAWRKERIKRTNYWIKAAKERAIRVENEMIQRFTEMTDEDKRIALKKQENALIPLAYEHSIRDCKRVIGKMKKALKKI